MVRFARPCTCPRRWLLDMLTSTRGHPGATGGRPDLLRKPLSGELLSLSFCARLAGAVSAVTEEQSREDPVGRSSKQKADHPRGCALIPGQARGATPPSSSGGKGRVTSAMAANGGAPAPRGTQRAAWGHTPPPSRVPPGAGFRPHLQAARSRIQARGPGRLPWPGWQAAPPTCVVMSTHSPMSRSGAFWFSL